MRVKVVEYFEYSKTHSNFWAGFAAKSGCMLAAENIMKNDALVAEVPEFLGEKFRVHYDTYRWAGWTWNSPASVLRYVRDYQSNYGKQTEMWCLVFEPNKNELGEICP